MKLFETEKNKEIKKLRMAQDREWKNIVEDAEETTKELCEKYYEGKRNFTHVTQVMLHIYHWRILGMRFRSYLIH